MCLSLKPLVYAVALGNLGVYYTDEGKSGETVEVPRVAITVESSLNVSPASRENSELQFKLIPLSDYANALCIARMSVTANGHVFLLF